MINYQTIGILESQKNIVTGVLKLFYQATNAGSLKTYRRGRKSND